MMQFKQFFYETLRVGDAHARGQLAAHPLVRQGTFGVEVEFKVLGLPPNAWDDQTLANGLQETPFEEELYQRHGGRDEEDQETGETVHVGMNRREWAKFFEEYVRTHKEEAIEAWMDHYGEKADSHMWRHIKGHWQAEARRAIEAAGFKVRGDQASGPTWGVGDDGLDSEESRPVVEVRSGIMTPADEGRLLQVLQGFQKMFQQNKAYVQAAGNTGLHVHVSNPAVNRGGSADPFSRLASLAGVDEDRIWDDMAPHDRAFERYALLNRQQDFSSYKDTGFHQMVLEYVKFRLKPKGAGPRFTANVTAAELAEFMSGFERNAGVNVKSEHPTVEYRQLSSALLTEPQGPRKVIDYIRYFSQNTAGLANKNQFSVKDGNERAVFTRLPGGARVDFQGRDDDEQSFPRVPQHGHPAADLRDHPADRRPPWMPLNGPRVAAHQERQRNRWERL